MTTSVKSTFLPPSLISNLQQVLITRTNNEADDDKELSSSSCPSPCEKEIIAVTNGEGIESSGLTSLVQALVRDGRFNVYVCAPQSDRSVSGHSVTVREKLTASFVDIAGVTAAYQVSGTPADCVSLALSGALFSWSKPALVISGINRGSSCGHNMFYSGAIAAAREALICGVPALCEKWSKLGKRFEGCSQCFYAFTLCCHKRRQKRKFPQNIEIPTCPIANKGFKVTKHSAWRSSLSWQEVSQNRRPCAANFMSNQQSLGMKLAQLSRDASAAGANRRLSSHRKDVEIESVGVAGKVNPSQTVKKYFRLELSEKEQENVEEDVDFGALENGFIAVTPLCLSVQPEIHALVSNWIATALAKSQ